MSQTEFFKKMFQFALFILAYYLISIYIYHYIRVFYLDFKLHKKYFIKYKKYVFF